VATDIDHAFRVNRREFLKALLGVDSSLVISFRVNFSELAVFLEN